MNGTSLKQSLTAVLAEAQTSTEKCLTNAERGADCYDACIRYPMSMHQARIILEFAGRIASSGTDPVQAMKTLVADYTKDE